MELQTIRYEPGSGWSPPTFPALDSSRTLVLCFGESGVLDDPGPLAQLVAHYPQACLVGCSSAGEILDGCIEDNLLAAAVVRFEHTRLQAAQVTIDGPADSRGAGRRLSEALCASDLRGVLVLSDGLSVNGTELARGLGSGLPAGIPVAGGLAADGDRFARTWVLHEGKPARNLVSAVGFYGDRIEFRCGSKGGWDVFGVERRITRSRGNVLYELDGKPALELYKRYLGERASGLPATGLLFPLGIRREDEDHHIVRTILAVDEEHQSLTFAGDVPEGSLAQLMRANFDRLIGGAFDAAQQAGCPSVQLPVLSIAISCVGRRLVLGERAEEEVEATLEVLPPGTQQIGFYSYGEISPCLEAVGCELHNQTMTLTTMYER